MRYLVVISSLFIFSILIIFLFLFKELYLYASFFFLISQSIIGLYGLNKINKGFYLQDIRIFFILSFTLYSCFLPLISIVGLIQIFPNYLPKTTLLYGIALFAFNCYTLLRKRKWNNINNIKYNSNVSIIAILWLMLLVILSIYYMHSKGISIFSFGAKMTPRTILGENVTQLWVVLSFTIIAVANFLIFNFPRINNISRIFLLLVLLLYFVFQLSLGNRREIAGIIFFSMAFILSYYKKKINLSIIILLLLIFIGSFAITLLREEGTRNLDRSDKVQIALASNEFVYPMQTTIYLLKDKWPIRYGSTYFLLPIQVTIPRIIYPDKPSTLGGEFTLKTFGPGFQGFAYTPVSEAYLNFGYLGPFIVFFFVAILFDYILKINSSELSFIYFLSYGLVFDFCRGDFASIFYAILIMYFFGYRFVSYLSKLRIKLQAA